MDTSRTFQRLFPSLEIEKVLLGIACALLVISLAGFARAQSDVQLDSKVFQIASQLRCPVCVAESVADSQSPTSQEMRQIIRQQLAEGKSEQQIINFFKARYGDWILLNPPKRGLHLVVWVLPLLGLAVALTLLAFYFRRWLKRAKAPLEASPEELERVHQEMSQQPEGP